MALSRLEELGEQAVIAVAASLARGGPVVKGQLIASRFYEAMQRELKQLPMHVDVSVSQPQGSILATCWIELRRALAVLSDDHPSEPPPRGRPVLRLIEGGLSKV